MAVVPIQWHGAVLFSDFTTLLGGQESPPISITDYLGAAPLFALGDVEGFRSDPDLCCIYAQPVFVPFHNQGNQPSIIDRDAWIAENANLPRVRWDIEAFPVGSAQQFQDTTYRSQYLDFTAKPAFASNATLKATCDTWLTPGGTATPWNEQGFKLFFSRLRYGGYSDSSTPVFDVSFVISGDTWRVSILASGGMSIYRNDSLLRGGESGGIGSSNGGAIYPDSSISRMGCLSVTVLNGKVKVSADGSQFGGSTPYVADVYSNTHGEITTKPDGNFGISASLVSRLPKVPFKAVVWDKGKTPDYATADEVTVTSISGGNLVASGGRGLSDGANIGVIDPRVESVSVSASDFTQISLSLHPLRFRRYASLRSNLSQIGFVKPSSVLFKYRVWTAQTAKTVRDGGSFAPYGAPGCTVSVATSEGILGTPFVQYDLNIDNGQNDSYAGTEYANATVAILRVTSHADGKLSYSPPSYAAVEFGTTRLDGEQNGYPLKGFEESLSFNPESQTIDHRLSLTLDNFYGIDAVQLLTGVNGTGNIGVAMRWGYKHLFDGPSWFGGSPSVSEPGHARFVGYAHTYDYARDGGSNHGTVTLECSDQMMQLGDTQIETAPNMDGWNHYYAVAWLLQKSGIPLSRMAFADLVPAEPDEATDDDAQPYFLPIGVGLNPWTPLYTAVKVRDLLFQIQKVSGNLLFFDAYGRARYEPWVPGQQAYQPKRVFSQSQSLDTEYNLTGIENYRGRTSTLDTRNVVALIGIDAFSDSGWYAPIVSKLEDSASISSLPGQQPLNYKGYRSPFIWADSRFAVEGFARDSAIRLFNTMRLPDVTVTFDCWGQPDIYPLDPIAVYETKSKADARVYYVMSITTRLMPYGGSMRPKSFITARYLDPTAI